MIGAISFNPCLTVPEGFLLCDGSLVLKADYPELYSVIGDIYAETGDSDETKFRLPKGDGRRIFGPDESDIVAVGVLAGKDSIDTRHSHRANSHTHTGSGSTGGSSTNDTDKNGSSEACADHTHNVSSITCGTPSVDLDTTEGGSSSVPIRNRSMAIEFVIKY